MTRRDCPKKKCYAGDGVECDEGWSLEKCPFYQAEEKEASVKAESTSFDGQARFFWTGDTFGTDDLMRVAARGRPITMALIGDSDAGKTSFLVTMYFHLLRGEALGNLRFAGSWTLGAWEALAAKMRWSGNTPPGFPLHTPRGQARQPGLLHLALRDSTGTLVDVLFADAPGEWFERWAVNRNAPEAQGARWLEEHADAAIVFIDSERLSDPERRGSTRQKMLQLLSRMADTYTGRPWRAAWSKHDQFEENPVTNVISEQLTRLNSREPFAIVSANVDQPSRGIIEAVTWLIAAGRDGIQSSPPIPEITDSGGLLSFRGEK